MRLMPIWPRFATALTVALLGGSGAVAQEATPQMKVEDLQRRYEEAVKAGDWDALTALFTEGATLMPMEGGYIAGPTEARSYFEQSGITRLDARSGRMETIGDNLVYDLGSFTATFSRAGEETEVEGEYVALAEDGEDGLRLRSLVTFPTRQSPYAWTQ